MRFPYISFADSRLPTDLMPYLPISLNLSGNTVNVFGLVDSGASVNVLPYGIGIELGAVWENQPNLFRLGGNLGNYEAKGLIMPVKVGNFQEVKLAFAWTKAENVPLILGQVNFFSEFDVCFFRSSQEFEIKPKK